MEYRSFGKTGVKLSSLGFGCMRLPVLEEDISRIDEKEAAQLIRYGIDSGINYIDTAYPYHGTNSEPFLAKALSGGYRDRIYLATKLPSWFVHTREDMDRYLNEQLKRLNTDRIDFYLLHRPDGAMWPNYVKNNVYEFLDTVKKDGRVRFVGFSYHDQVDLFKEIVDSYDWDFCQIQYNYLDEYSQAGTEGLEYASQKGLGIAVMEPLRGGSLVDNIPEEASEILQKAGLSNAQAGLFWVLNHREVGVVLSGMNTRQQVDENIRSAALKPGSLPQEQLLAIEKARDIIKSKVRIGCTGCRYCVPCPAGVNIPACFDVFNSYYGIGKEDLPTYRFKYTAMIPKINQADNCLECRSCESKCPQHIEISRELKKVHELFK